MYIIKKLVKNLVMHTIIANADILWGIQFSGAISSLITGYSSFMKSLFKLSSVRGKKGNIWIPWMKIIFLLKKVP